MGVYIDGTPIEYFRQLGIKMGESLKERSENLQLKDINLEKGQKAFYITEVESASSDGRSYGWEEMLIITGYEISTKLPNEDEYVNEDIKSRMIQKLESQGFFVRKLEISSVDEPYEDFKIEILKKYSSIMGNKVFNLKHTTDCPDMELTAKKVGLYFKGDLCEQLDALIEIIEDLVTTEECNYDRLIPFLAISNNNKDE